ncbi:uncharacterized protein PRCAT00001738001 [Priceomyces carsonii]|uniref:uncharacterized protein n=1 Tax=Priceomyces carsonii TaxID=28549 RepID=UPI002ED98B67|nr:unnamed protein product [Priceomyces carsonii]
MSEDTLNQSETVNVACLDLLLQEVVPTSIRVTHTLGENRLIEEKKSKFKETKVQDPLSTIPKDFAGRVNVLERLLSVSDDVTLRVEGYGYSLGQRISELLMYRSSLVSPNTKFVDILDIMKFVCRDVWKCLYGKQMDNLRTNHRGTFVLVDNSYRLISRMNSPKGMHDTLNKAKCFLWFPCGIIRGILISFGIDATVTAEVTQFPSVTFHIQTSINN